MAINLKGRSFLTLADFTPAEIRYLLDLGHDLKAKRRAGVCAPTMQGKHIVLLFEKTSTRTRCSFEVAATQEGAHVTYLDAGSSQMGKKESLEDSAKVLGRFFDGIEYRGYDQRVVEDLAKWSGVPVWNGLTDADHPTQILADLMTIEEHCKKPLNKVKVVFPGDVRNNMCYAWMMGAAKLGMHFVAMGPEELARQMDQAVVQSTFAEARKNGGLIEITDHAEDLKGADVIYGDVWASMGQEEERAVRAKALVWPIALIRDGDRYRIIIEEPLDTALLEGDAEEKALAVAAFYTEANERMVRRAPDQWFWMHNRWKTKRVMDD